MEPPQPAFLLFLQRNCKTQQHPRARWWSWSAGSEEHLLCRSSGSGKEVKSRTLQISEFYRKNLDLQLNLRRFAPLLSLRLSLKMLESLPAQQEMTMDQ
jgi:hypothetical protein